MFLKTSRAHHFLFLWKKKKGVSDIYAPILLGWLHPHLTWVHVSHKLKLLGRPNVHGTKKKLLKDAAIAHTMAFN